MFVLSKLSRRFVPGLCVTVKNKNGEEKKESLPKLMPCRLLLSVLLCLCSLSLLAQLLEVEKAEMAAATGDPSWEVRVAVSLERYQRLLDAPDREEEEWSE